MKLTVFVGVFPPERQVFYAQCLICAALFVVLNCYNLLTEYKKKPYSYSGFDCIVYSIQCSGSCSVWAVWQRGLRPVVQESASWRTASQSPQVSYRCFKLFLWWPLQGLCSFWLEMLWCHGKLKWWFTQTWMNEYNEYTNIDFKEVLL